jgi:poly(3-hydroxybutyrate) depolymerase
MRAAWSLLGSVVPLVVLAGCQSIPGDTQEQEVRSCPESVRPDDRGQPRNAAGLVRYCWPGEARCFCDRSGDCYAEQGYRPCRPVRAVADAGSTVRDAGSTVRDAGSTVRDAGSTVRDAGSTVSDAGGTVRDAGSAVSDAGGTATLPGADNPAYSGSFPVRTGRFTATLRVAGEDREVVLYVPTNRPANPPLVLAFHGTNGSGSVMLDEGGAQALAQSQGVVVAAPSSRWIGRGDWDHRDESTYWETHPNLDLDRNPDLVLARAVLAEAQRRYAIDPRRVYAIGHSNGGFFATLVATRLNTRIAAFATSSAGLVQCNNTWSCGFEGSGTTCAQLATQRGWCNCNGTEKPGPLDVVGRRPPAYLAAGTRDPLVTVYYTCAMEARMRSLGYTVRTVLRDGDGHVMPERFAQEAWSFLSAHRLP